MLNHDAPWFPDEIGKTPQPDRTPWLLVGLLVVVAGWLLFLNYHLRP